MIDVVKERMIIDWWSWMYSKEKWQWIDDNWCTQEEKNVCMYVCIYFICHLSKKYKYIYTYIHIYICMYSMYSLLTFVKDW